MKLKRAAALSCLLTLTPAGPAAAAEPAVVAFAQDTLDNDWRAAQASALAAGLGQLPGVRFVLTDAQGRTANQIRDIENLSRRGVDVLITSPRDSRAMTPVIAGAHRSGIPVILLTRRIATDDYTTFIGADDRAIARSAAEYIASALAGRGKVLMLKGLPTATTALDRREAFLEVIADHPGIEVVEKTGNYLRADAAEATEEALREGHRFDAIYAHSDSMVQGALLVLEAMQVPIEPLVIVGIDYIEAAREAIRAGRQDASFVYPTCAAEATRAVAALLAGEGVPRRITVESTLVTRDNVEAVEPIF